MPTSLDLNNLKNYLTERKLTISVAESLTSGMLQNKLASVSGISSCYQGGITAYSLESKALLLNVDPIHAKLVNCVSEKVAKEMALGVKNLLLTDISIATTGYAEPYPEQGVSVPYAFVCVIVKDSVYALKVKYTDAYRDLPPEIDPDCREKMRNMVTRSAIKLLLSALGISQ